MGPDGEEGCTNVCIVKWPPNSRVEPHSHASDYCELILEGTQRVGPDWFKAGDLRIATAGQIYGPLESGDEGCTIAVIFNGPGWLPIPAREGTFENVGEVARLVQGLTT